MHIPYAVLTYGTSATPVIEPQGSLEAPTDVIVTSVQPTSITYAWKRPNSNQEIVGYSFMLLFKGTVMHSGLLDTNTTSLSIHNLILNKSLYELRVAAVLPDGTVGDFSPPLTTSAPSLCKLIQISVYANVYMFLHG